MKLRITLGRPMNIKTVHWKFNERHRSSGQEQYDEWKMKAIILHPDVKVYYYYHCHRVIGIIYKIVINLIAFPFKTNKQQSI